MEGKLLRQKLCKEPKVFIKVQSCLVDQLSSSHLFLRKIIYMKIACLSCFKGKERAALCNIFIVSLVM